MIVDAHCHLYREDVPSRAWWDTFVKVSASLSGKTEERIRSKVPGWLDPTGDMLISDMDEAGIDKSVVLLIDFAMGEYKDVTSLEDQHIMYAEAVKRHPDRLIAFAGIDPRRPETSKFLEKAVKEWNMKGLKIHPALGFYPNEPCCYRLYETCQQLGLPVLIHAGPEVSPWYSKFGMPIYFDDICNDFPELTIIMAHAGGCYWQEAVSIASNKLNLYVDLAWWQAPLLNLTEEEFYRRIRELVNTAGRSRVLWGSDWPAMRQVRRLDHTAWTNAMKEAPERAKKYGITFTEEEIGMIMGGNAVKVLGL